MKNSERLRLEILSLVKDYYDSKNNETPKSNRVPYAARVYDEKEMQSLVDSALEFWLTAGRYAQQFETNLASFLGVRHTLLVNSGSSANLLAFMSLTSPLLGERRIMPGDEVITVACGFPTTISPIIQYGAVPVFLDVTIPQYNIDVSKLEEALSNKTKAIMIAHTMGNPFDLSSIIPFARKHNLWVIEDNCDALGSKYTLNGETKYTGTFGDFGTSSFYPPHHMTMGDGGAVYTNNPLLYKIAKSMRDWGRECVCPSGQDNFCGHRFDGKFGELPIGYDHKYVYSHFGYNLKATDLQAAVGVEQLKKLPTFIEKRIRNFEYLYDGLKDLSDYLVLPKRNENSYPSWFGFLISVKDNLSRNKLSTFLEENNIQTRNLFAGNITKHPCFTSIKDEKDKYRIVGDLTQTDFVMNNTFFIGVYPGLTNEQLDYMIQKIHEGVYKQLKGE